MLDANELPDLLAARQNAQLIASKHAMAVKGYSEWDRDVMEVDSAFEGESIIHWPDMPEATDKLNIPNIVRLAAEDRARSASGVVPSLRCDPEGVKEKDKANSEKRERVGVGYLTQSYIAKKFQAWALDSGLTGVTLCEIMPNFSEADEAKRFPMLHRLNPRFCYPGPLYAQGPFLDDIVIGYELHLLDLLAMYPDCAAEVNSMIAQANKGLSKAATDKVQLLKYYSKDTISVACIPAGGNGKWKKKDPVVSLVHQPNPISRCPVTIGTRMASARYHGDFDGLLPGIATANTLVTMTVDEAIRYTYPILKSWGVRNPQDIGPDAHIELENPNGILEYTVPPSRYSNQQDIRMLVDFLRTNAAFSSSRSGDPDGSVISAAGIQAAQGQNTEIVGAIQQTMATMVQAAMEVAYEWDEKELDCKKTIYGQAMGSTFAETYVPSEVIKGNYRNRIVYPLGSGMSMTNQNAMVLQQQTAGFMSTETAMELSPFVENPQSEKKRIIKETLVASLMQGLIRDSAQPMEAGGIDPTQIAYIYKRIEEDPDITIFDAAMEILLPEQNAPLASPPGMQAPQGAAPSGMPGVEEAMEPAAPLPPMSALLGG